MGASRDIGLSLVLTLLAVVGAGCANQGEQLDLEIDPDATERCTDRDGHLVCERATVTFATGPFGWSAREVHVMHPTGTPPGDGWPVAILVQGSLHSAAGMFEASEGDAFGGYHQTRVVEALLEAGYAVLAPETRFDGSTFWDTNVAPWAFAWEQSEDHQLMVELLDAIDRGQLGALDPTRLYAAGISSGGYMTSRMAVSYPGRFQALAIQSASYATCSGFACDVPELPADHPPTLFLHGGRDLVVPARSAEDYADALTEQGTENRVVIDPEAEHAWIAASPEEIVAWFERQR